ncbi:hypothetical protein LZC95_19755 [Pendulispora brunnea]|uniref:Uncharacterized protein n=1 Tax=Pendulispora brunnea TaxID=2905690 RepID=A0ABZ2KKI0_9BACT
MNSTTREPQFHIVRTTLATACHWDLTLDALIASGRALGGPWSLNVVDPAEVQSLASEITAAWDPDASLLMIFADGRACACLAGSGRGRALLHLADPPSATGREALRAAGFTVGNSPELWTITRSALLARANAISR